MTPPAGPRRRRLRLAVLLLPLVPVVAFFVLAAWSHLAAREVKRERAAVRGHAFQPATRLPARPAEKAALVCERTAQASALPPCAAPPPSVASARAAPARRPERNSPPPPRRAGTASHRP